MNEDLKQNLPFFLALCFGGVVMLGLAGTVLYLQFRGVSSDVRQIEQPAQTQTGKPDTAQNDEATIVGTWIGPPTMMLLGEVRFKYVFEENGTYKWYFTSPTGTEEALYSSGEYKLTKVQGANDQIDIIALFRERFYQPDGSYTDRSPFDATGQTGALNLLELTRSRLCMYGDVAVLDPVNLRQEDWLCFTRATSTNSLTPPVSQQTPMNPSQPVASTVKPQSLLVGRWHSGYTTLVYTADGKYQGYNYSQANPPNLLNQSGLYSYNESTKTIYITHLINHDTSGNSINDNPGPDSTIQVRRLDAEKLCYAGVEDYQCWTRE